MNRLLSVLSEILFRLKEIPGLQFLQPYYGKVKVAHAKILKKQKELKNKKAYMEDKLKAAREIPSLVKGSKKKQ